MYTKLIVALAAPVTAGSLIIGGTGTAVAINTGSASFGSSAPQQLPAPGQTFNTGYLGYQVTGYRDLGKTVGRNASEPHYAAGHYVAAWMRVTNTAGYMDSVRTAHFSGSVNAVGTDGRVYRTQSGPSITFSVYDGANATAVDDVYPGSPVDVVAVFDMPNGVVPAHLVPA